MNLLPVFAIPARHQDLGAAGILRMVLPVPERDEVAFLEQRQTREGIVPSVGGDLFNPLDFHRGFFQAGLRICFDAAGPRVGFHGYGICWEELILRNHKGLLLLMCSENVDQ